MRQGEVFVNNRTNFPVSGVVHIPNVTHDPAGTVDSDQRKIYNDRIKRAVLSHGAVAVALHYDTTRRFTIPGTSERVYDNFQRTLGTAHAAETNQRGASGWNQHTALMSASDEIVGAVLGRTLSSDVNHAVVIVGWDDTPFTYTVPMPRPNLDGTGNITVNVPVTIPGAFIAYCNKNVRHRLSYDTPLTGAYYINGFININEEDSAGDRIFPFRSPPRETTGNSPTIIDKNLFAHTYEHDSGGFTSIESVTPVVVPSVGSQITYASVFRSIRGTAIQAVSLFLTGEDASAEIYIIDNIPDYTTLTPAAVGALLDNHNLPAPNATIDHEVTGGLPGYFTVPLTREGVTASRPTLKSVPIANDHFAVVVVVTGGTGSAVPVQNNAGDVRGYVRNGNGTNSWRRLTGQAICIRAHAEALVEMELAGLQIRNADGEETFLYYCTTEVAPGVPRAYVNSRCESPDPDDPPPACCVRRFCSVAKPDATPAVPPCRSCVDNDNCIAKPLEIAPRGEVTAGPTLVPTNANDVDHRDTVWEIDWWYYLRHNNGPKAGFLVLDINGSLIRVGFEPDPAKPVKVPLLDIDGAHTFTQGHMNNAVSPPVPIPDYGYIRLGDDKAPLYDHEGVIVLDTYCAPGNPCRRTSKPCADSKCLGIDCVDIICTAENRCQLLPSTGPNVNNYLYEPRLNSRGEPTPIANHWLTWDSAWLMFVPEYYLGFVAKPGRAGDRLGSHDDVWDGELAKIRKVDEKPVDYLRQPIAIRDPLSGATRIGTSELEHNFFAEVPLRVTVTTRDKHLNGSFIREPEGFRATHSATTLISLKPIGVAELIINRTDELPLRVGQLSTAFSVRQLDDKGEPATPLRVEWRVVRGPEFRNEVRERAWLDPAPGVDRDHVFSTGWKAYDPLDPFGGPIAVINGAGRVTALNQGIVFVYALVSFGGEYIRSEACRITITGVRPTGVTLNRRTHTMSVDTLFTLTANVRPAGAENRRVTFSSSDPDIVDIVPGYEHTGLLEAKKPGTATITVLTDLGNHAARSVITVTPGPSAVVRIGRSTNFTVMGTNAQSDMVWTIGYSCPIGPSGCNICLKRCTAAEPCARNSSCTSTAPCGYECTRDAPCWRCRTRTTHTHTGHLAACRRGFEYDVDRVPDAASRSFLSQSTRHSVRMEARNPGPTKLIGKLMQPNPIYDERHDPNKPTSWDATRFGLLVHFNRDNPPAGWDPNKENEKIVVREQTWNLHAVNPIGRFDIQFANGHPSTLRLRRVLLGFTATDGGNAALGETVQLTVPVSTTGGTFLGFAWEERRTSFLDISTSGENDETVEITALAHNSRNIRLTATNFNGRRRTNLTMRVLHNPTVEQITSPRLTSSINLKTGGRALNAQVRVDRNTHPIFTYHLEAPEGITLTQAEIANIATLDPRDRRDGVRPARPRLTPGVTAGQVVLVIIGNCSCCLKAAPTLPPAPPVICVNIDQDPPVHGAAAVRRIPVNVG
jgi:hypothetical protein